MPSKHTSSCEKDSLKTKVVDPDLGGKVVLITGGTGGIGAELVVHLSQIPKPPAHIIFTGRNTASADAVIERCRRQPGSPSPSVAAAVVPSTTPGPVQAFGTPADPHPGNPVDSNPLPTPPDDRSPSPDISFIPMDLASLESVSTASNQILSLLRGEPASSEEEEEGKARGRLDILLANAGIMATPPGLSPDGYEIQFATNHLGHALLIRKLLPLMLETANSPPPSSSSHPEGRGDERGPDSDVRIITTSSAGWRLGKVDNFPFEQLAAGDLFEGRTFFAKSLRYGNSKLANVVYARELALRYGDEAIAALSPSEPPSSSDGASGSANAHAGGYAASRFRTRDSGNGTGAGAERSIVPAAGPDSGTNGHDDINLDSISPPTTTRTTQAHGQRKGILSVSLTPGVVGTGLVNDLPMADKALVYVSQLGKILTPEEGIRNHLWALSSPRQGLVPGAYYEPVGRLWSKSASDQIGKKDPLLGRKMWDWTEEVIGRWL